MTSAYFPYSIVTCAHQRSGCIFRCFLSRDVDWLVKAFVTYVRPIVEYASPVWNPTAFLCEITRLAVDMDIHGYIHGYIYGYIHVWI